LELITESLRRLGPMMPPPNFEGYAARSVFRQGLLSPSKHGWYLGQHIETKMNGETKIKISSRALLDLLADRITVEQFRDFLGEAPPGNNLFKRWLDMGKTLAEIKIEPAGADDDDDYLVLSFKDDPAAGPLRLKPRDNGP
jgi:hypothetical protein